MRLATVGQSKEIDHMSQKAYGLSGEVLMEAAGALAAREVDQAYFPEVSSGMTAIVCGPGNNGGDGLVLARHMHSSGYRNIIVFLLAPTESRTDLFNLQWERAEKHGLKIVDGIENTEKLEGIRSAKLVIDALFGIGLAKPITGPFQKAVDLMNSLKVPVVSLDCPSGLNCDCGIVDGTVVKAAMTLSFGLAKPGFFVADGPAYVGRLRVVPIGFPYECLRGIATTHFAFNDKLARRYLPVRKDKTHKYDFGHLMVIAGKEGLWGAGQLASAGAYRIGAGYVTWASFEQPCEDIKEVPEILTKKINNNNFEELLEDKTPDAVVIGPGLGVTQETANVIRHLKEKFSGPVVVDADGITASVQFDLFPFPENWVLTPHSGELARVIKIDSREIEQDRYAAALKAAETTGCHVLLKGYRSVLGYKDRCMVINSGNSALAKAGTGDVLAGMVGGLLAQGLDTLQGTATAAYIHGRMADEWVRIGHSKSALLASDLKDHLPALLGRISGGALI